MKKSLFGFFLLALACSATAEPIEVRSGEHENFTRLVLQLPPDANWELDNEPGKSVLTIDDFDNGFDLNRAFDIIPRTRLTALLAQKSTLELQLSCDCPVFAFLEDSGFLVIDISNPTNESSELQAAPILEPIPDSNYQFGELLWENQDDQSEEKTSSEAIEIEEADLSEASSESNLLAQLRKTLAEEFADASTRGLLDLKQPLAIPEETIANMDNSAFAQSTIGQAEIEPANSPNMRITSSRDLLEKSRPKNKSAAGSVCPDPEKFDVAKWGGDLSFNQQIGKANQNLYGDAGGIKKEEVVRRAKLYAYFGFGAEALNSLRMADGLLQEYPEVAYIAEILEYDFTDAINLPDRFASCSSRVALWAALNLDPSNSEIEINSAEALLALAELPSHLKGILAKKLGEVFAQRGDLENAAIAKRHFNQLKEQQEPEATLVEAWVAAETGDLDLRDTILEEVTTENSADSPRALSETVRNLVASGSEVPADIVLLSEAYAFELKNTEAGFTAFETFILAALHSNQYEKALSAIDNPTLELSKSEKEVVSDLAWLEISESANSSTFVSSYFEYFPSSALHLSPRTIIDVSSRLLEVGLQENSASLIQLLDESYESYSLYSLKARLAFFSGDYDSTVDLLGAPVSQEDFELKASALERLGKYEEAAENYSKAEQHSKADTALWLSKNWKEKFEGSNSAFGELSRLANDDFGEIVIDTNFAKNGKSGVLASESARKVVSNALSDLEVME